MVSQYSSSSLGSGGNKDGEEEVLAGSVDQVTPVSTKRSFNKSRETGEILNFLKASQDQTKNTLEQIDTTLAASSPDVKKSWCLWMELNVKDIDLSLWRSFQNQLYQMITQYIDLSQYS